MNIVVGEEKVQPLRDRYTVLSLDAFQVKDHEKIVKSFCVIETVPVHEMNQIDQWKDLHENLIINYGRRNWNYCEQALEHLMGKWNGAVDSFYLDLGQRVKDLKSHDPGPDWSPCIKR